MKLGTAIVTGLILAFLSYGFTTLIPLQLELDLRIEIFKAVGQLGGIMLGFMGLIAVFGLESLRSNIRELRKQEAQVKGLVVMQHFAQGLSSALSKQTEKTEASVQPIVDATMQASQKTLAYGIKTFVAFVASVIFFVLQFLFAILGLGTASSEIWRQILFLSLTTLLLGILAFLYMALYGTWT